MISPKHKLLFVVYLLSIFISPSKPFTAFPSARLPWDLLVYFKQTRTCSRSSNCRKFRSATSLAGALLTEECMEQQQDTVSRCFGGLLRRIHGASEEKSFLNVPTFAVFPLSGVSPVAISSTTTTSRVIQRKGLEAIVPGAFVLQNVLSKQTCEEIIDTCENLKFGNYTADKSNHGAMQIVVSKPMADDLFSILSKYMHSQFFDFDMDVPDDDKAMLQHKFHRAIGINRRWRIYRYAPGGEEIFCAHIDAGFPGSGITLDGKALLWDAHEKQQNENVVSRLTILMYLNHDFIGGQTKFYSPITEGYFPTPNLIAAVKPEAGSMLIFPQAVGKEFEIFACMQWATHEGSPVLKLPEPLVTRPKYVIRSDVLFSRCSVDDDGAQQASSAAPS